MPDGDRVFVRVLLPVRATADGLFDYIVKASQAGEVQVGALVIVPFRNEVLTGVVVSVMALSEKASREIIGVLDKSLWQDQDILEVSSWMATEYLCPRGVAWRSAMMGGIALRTENVYKISDDTGNRAGNKTTRQIARMLGKGWRESLAGLLRKGDIEKHSVYTPRLLLKNRARVVVPATAISAFAAERPELTKEQKFALDAVSAGGSHLLLGVTGSGKTEVYMRLVESRLLEGKGSIVLIPEISLTPQTVARFRARFGDSVAVLHSGLTLSEKYAEWRRIKLGEASVCVGARSAVFAPVRNLGQIIIDEEHDGAYKQEEDPKYVASMVARARSENVVLGSATPSIETYYRSLQGEHNLVQMRERVGGGALPPVSVVDMREELKSGNRTIFSKQMSAELSETLSGGRQAILLLNRRGHSTFVMCRECGYVVKCPWCDVSAVYHSTNDRVMCHYCSWTQKAPASCPHCGSPYIRYFGAGTERVMEEVKSRFPGARVERLDRDTTRRKGAFADILSRFRSGETDVLVGTQMVSKGHDIPGVTLVGIVSADIILNLPDFRSAERTYQLLTQSAGRAGRSQYPGRVVIQTYSPEHYAISAAARGDYQKFYEEEIALRKDLGYPPFGHLLSVAIRGKSADECLHTGKRVVTAIERSSVNGLVEVLGPAPQAVSKVKQVHRWQVLIKAPDRDSVRQAANVLLREMSDRISLDLNPANVI